MSCIYLPIGVIWRVGDGEASCKGVSQVIETAQMKNNSLIRWTIAFRLQIGGYARILHE